MNQKKIDPSEVDLLASANEILRWQKSIEKTYLDEIPVNWFTREKLQKMLNLKKTKLVVILREGIAKGSIDKKEFMVFENGRKVVKPYYFLK